MITPSALIFMINTRLDFLDHLLAHNFGNLNETFINEAWIQVNEMRRLLKEARHVSIVFKEKNNAILKEVMLLMFLVARRLVLRDFEGVQWCFSEIRKITGYTPTPNIWIPGKVLMRAVNTTYF